MKIVTNQQIEERWEQVPESLRETFFSPDIGDIIWNICEQVGLSEEITDQVVTVVGNVVLGFVHPDDMAAELLSISDIDPKVVDSLVFQIDRKILAPVRSDIDRLFTASGASRMAIPAAVPKESVERIEPVVETPQAVVAASTPPIAKAEIEAPVMLHSEKETIQEQSTIVPEKMMEQKQEIEAPAIIHAESDIKPIAQTRRSLSSFGGLFKMRNAPERKESSSVAAQISVSPEPERKQEEMSRTEQPKIRVVHYTEAKPVATENIFGSGVSPSSPTGAPHNKEQATAQGAFEPQLVNLAVQEEQPAPQTAAPVIAESQRFDVSHTKVPADMRTQTQTSEPVVVADIEKATTPEQRPVVMKTPQRPAEIAPEIGAQRAQETGKIKLTDVPVAGEVIDLRAIETMNENKN